MSLNIVENTLNEFGLRTLHAVDFNAPISRDAIMELVPAEGKESLGVYPVYDKELKMHHVYAVWNAREVVDFERVNQFLANAHTADDALTPCPSPIDGRGVKRIVPVRYGVMWWIAKGETMSLAIELAAQLYLEQMKRWPTMVWANKLPANAPDCYRTVKDGQVTDLPLQVATWVPERFIVVGIPAAEWDAKYDESAKKYV
ncbi:MAG TPA: hypothetical protein PK040_02035 [Anaerolineaceae bacterium]|nr:hypothetical protein [Anaerolineaceae bacterium]